MAKLPFAFSALPASQLVRDYPLLPAVQAARRCPASTPLREQEWQTATTRRNVRLAEPVIRVNKASEHLATGLHSSSATGSSVPALPR